MNALGARTKQTADEVVETAIREYERALFWQQYADAADAAAADLDVTADELAERELWERTNRDGVERA